MLIILFNKINIKIKAGMAGPFSFIPALGPQTPDSRAFYEYAPTTALGLPPNMAAQLGANPNANGHRLNDAATAYAISTQFGREQLIQRNTLQPFVS